MEWLEISVTALVSALVLLVEHYAPVRTRRATTNYILGVLALVIPFSCLMALWGLWLVLVAIWSVVCAGGLAVLAAYAIDQYLALRSRMKAAEQAEKLLRPTEISNYATDDNE